MLDRLQCRDALITNRNGSVVVDPVMVLQILLATRRAVVSHV